MPELTDTFTNLKNIYADIWPLTNHAGLNRAALMGAFTAPHWYGVYIIYQSGQIEPVYIGSAGKLEKDADGALVRTGQKVRQRLFYANTPYLFDRADPVLRYGPTTPTVPPDGYDFYIPIQNIYIDSFHVPDTHAATALEHILIQGCVNEFGRLPVANQKI